MTRGIRTRPAFAAMLLAASCVLAAAAIATAKSSDGQPTGSKLRAPTLLWKSFPLTPQATAGSRPRRASPAASSPSASPRDPLVLSLLIAIIVGSAAVVLFGIPTPARVAAVPRRVQRRRFRQPGAVAQPVETHEDLLEALRPRPPKREQPKPTAPAAPAPAQLSSGPVRTRPVRRQERTTVERCEIRLWRGFVKCQLVAVVDGGGVIAQSPYFRLKADEVPSEKAHEALLELLAGLETSGWKVVDRGLGWYDRRLERAPDGSGGPS